MSYRNLMNFCAKYLSHWMFRPVAFYIVLIAVAPSVQAEWSGGIEGGTVVRDAGNANRIRLVLTNNDTPFSQYVYAEWLSTAAGGSNYAVGYNPRYWLSEKNYVFGESEFRTDDALGIDREIKLLGGVGRQIIRTEEQGLFAEVGVGGRSTKRAALNSLAVDEDATTEGLGLARLGYFRSIADQVKFDLNVSGTLSADDVSELASEAGVSLRLPQGSVRLAYRSRYLKIGDADAITDDDSFVSFGYSF